MTVVLEREILPERQTLDHSFTRFAPTSLVADRHLARGSADRQTS